MGELFGEEEGGVIETIPAFENTFSKAEKGAGEDAGGMSCRDLACRNHKPIELARLQGREESHRVFAGPG